MEEVTAREVKNCMNSLYKDMQMTVELETDFLDRFMPTLDTKMKISILLQQKKKLRYWMSSLPQ